MRKAVILFSQVLDFPAGQRGGDTRRGMEQWQLVGLITRRSLVRIQLPLPCTYPVYQNQGVPAPLITSLAFLVASRGGPTRSHPEHGSETPQRRRYCLGNWVWKIGRCQGVMLKSLLCSQGRFFFLGPTPGHPRQSNALTGTAEHGRQPLQSPPPRGTYVFRHEGSFSIVPPTPQGKEKFLFLGEHPQAPGRGRSQPAPPCPNRNSELLPWYNNLASPRLPVYYQLIFCRRYSRPLY